MPATPPASPAAGDEKPEFSRALAQLYEQAGEPTYAELIHQAAAQQPPVTIGKSSLGDWLSGKSIPSSARVVEVLIACLQAKATRRGHSPMAPGWWEAQRTRAHRARHANRGGRPARRPVPGDDPRAGGDTPAPGGLGWPVKQVDPIALDLGVHPAIDAGAAAAGLSALPTYLPRAHDAALAAVVDEVQVCGRSRMVVLVGGSSTGKTRACWEAIRSLPAPWWLWHPINPGWAQATLAGLEAVKPYTVVWLNETQHYLTTPGDPAGEQVAAGLRELLRSPERGPVLVLGTLWQSYWAKLTAVPRPDDPDPHAGARVLLAGTAMELPEAFTDDDLATAAAAGMLADPRTAEAVKQAPSGQLTQYLAGGPALIERYRTASVEARAVLEAAIDARRLGHSLKLPRLFLEEAAAGYLSDEQHDLLADNWLEQAFAYLTDPLPCRGARAPLTRIKNRPGPSTAAGQHEDEPSYQLADYLEQHGAHTRRWKCPPAGFWESAARHASATDQTALAKAAHSRGRYRHAAILWHRAADAGDTLALDYLAQMRAQAGDWEEAERLACRAADAGNTSALHYLSWARKLTGDRKEASRLYRLATDAEDLSVPRTLTLMQEPAVDQQRGKHPTFTVYTSVLGNLAKMRKEAGDHQEAERLYQLAADAGDTYALSNVAEIREQAGDRQGAEQFYQLAADAGDTSALWALARMREQVGDGAQAERLARSAADAGDPSALHKLAQMREAAGDRREAERLCRLTADIGDPLALKEMAGLRQRAGDEEGGARLVRFGLEADGRIADPW
ncbi:SEL1-like repeat protein [Streptosporangium sp. NBC_01469]|uniref:SEL1-like repeat protein n=1 Tax=Streptosporangium sp. NBC_01469 TaxID=2903898 RepID=UPI002E2D6AC7|nr:hypothetical protein [Streptosporangium sp. NBC_01469]